MNRRGFLGMALAAPAGKLLADGPETRVLRFGLTPVFLDHREALLRRWRHFLEQRLLRPVRFIQRGSYAEVMELLRLGDLDVAWLCSYPYVLEEERLRLLVTPVYDGRPLYRSYLIVPDSDQDTHTITDLQGRFFAYSDPDSLSGYHLPRHAIFATGADPDGYFARTIMSWTHRNAIKAVAERLVDGAAVDGYVWDMLKQHEPAVVARTRIVSRSRYHGFPPIVARDAFPEEDARHCREVLDSMSDHDEGRGILAALGLDGFDPTSPELYDSVRRIADEMAI
ncbi:MULTISPECIES: PhnD/SsuA/transferrin family substrate-binding protein [unclassified Thioalkalivibrio]|uniref:substrate-binding domain-containing protein n=1 Tax=unclassified Thioalkalivibrio TaxID=2621013 RepID=UPI0004094DB5|nr:MULTISPECIES: PhnD/SsuA/transferrin family substrate-binding protein [unclassified Thioalkalivibrio]